MAQPAFGYRKRDLAVAYAAFLSEHDCRHADLVGAFLRDEYRRMARGTVKPFGMLFVWVDHVWHRTLHLTHDIEIHDHSGGTGVVAVPTRLDAIFSQGLYPIYPVAAIKWRHAGKCGQRRLQRMRPGIAGIMYAIFWGRRIALARCS